MVSFVTVGELYYWAERRKWSAERISSFEKGIRAAIVVPYDLEICRAYAKLKGGLKTPSSSRRPIGDNDLWIAACAVRHGIPLITHNRRHFQGIPGLSVVSEAPLV
jgi:predicted nucleic acid-binding protein